MNHFSSHWLVSGLSSWSHVLWMLEEDSTVIFCSRKEVHRRTIQLWFWISTLCSFSGAAEVSFELFSWNQGPRNMRKLTSEMVLASSTNIIIVLEGSCRCPTHPQAALMDSFAEARSKYIWDIPVACRPESTEGSKILCPLLHWEVDSTLTPDPTDQGHEQGWPPESRAWRLGYGVPKSSKLEDLSKRNLQTIMSISKPRNHR